MCAILVLLVFNSVLKSSLKLLNKMLRKTLKIVITITQYKYFWTIVMFFVICKLQWKKLYVHHHKHETSRSDNPVIMWWTPEFPGTMETKVCSESVKCDVYSNKNLSRQYNIGAYLFYGSQINLNDFPPRHRVIWGLYHEESPRNLEVLMHEKMLNLFNFSSTFSRYSNVPYPLQYFGSIKNITSTEYFITTKEKNSWLNKIAPIMYLQSDCETSTERDKYVKQLMKFVPIDSYGACINNKKLHPKFVQEYLNNLDETDFLKFVARYKFVVAIENGVCEDYVTEKFWRAILVGSVPIYFGSPSIRDWLPNKKSAILLKDYPSPEILSTHLKMLLNNDSMYEEYLKHKISKLITNKRLIEEIAMRPYQNDIFSSVQKFECFICKKLHDKSNIGVNIVNKWHYNCPKPVSALTLSVNPMNSWVLSWEYALKQANELYVNLTHNIK